MSRLDDTSRCPVAAACATCGGTDGPAVATVATPVGVYCTTLCSSCADSGHLTRPSSWAPAIDAVAAHCGHLDVTADQMAALIEAEHTDDADGW